MGKNTLIGITAPSMGVSGVISKKLDNSIKQLEMMGYRCVETTSDGIREAINDNGGIITIYDTIDLQLARKP